MRQIRSCYAWRELSWAPFEISRTHLRVQATSSPQDLNYQGRWELLCLFIMSAFSETQSAQKRSSPLVSTKPERLFLFCLTLPKKREVFPESRIIYSRDQKAPCSENFLLMQLCRCHSTDMSKERTLGKITWMSSIIQHD